MRGGHIIFSSIILCFLNKNPKAKKRIANLQRNLHHRIKKHYGNHSQNKSGIKEDRKKLLPFDVIRWIQTNPVKRNYETFTSGDQPEIFKSSL
jgi:hypothetical protein